MATTTVRDGQLKESVDLTLEVTGVLPVANGGTNGNTFTANSALLGNGTSAFQTVAPGATGNVLTSNGTTWASSTPAAGGTGITRSVTSITANTTAGATAATDYEYICTGTLTLTLPTAVSNTNVYTVSSTDGLTTVATTSSQTIIGSLTATLPIANMSLSFVSNGSNWVII